MTGKGIDLDKLRAAIRRLGDEYVYYMLDAAIELLPQSDLVRVVRPYLDLEKHRPDREPEPDLLGTVTKFDSASRAGGEDAVAQADKAWMGLSALRRGFGGLFVTSITAGVRQGPVRSGLGCRGPRSLCQRLSSRNIGGVNRHSGRTLPWQAT